MGQHGTVAGALQKQTGISRHAINHFCGRSGLTLDIDDKFDRHHHVIDAYTGVPGQPLKYRPADGAEADHGDVQHGRSPAGRAIMSV